MAARLIHKTWKVGGVLTDVTTAKLSDPTGTYGVKRNDTGVAVVPDGTLMPKTATGTYEYSFDDIECVSYTAYVEFAYGGSTYHYEVDLPARAPVSEMAISYSVLLERIGHLLFGIRTGYSADQISDIADSISDGLGDVYAAHDWSFFRPVTTITTADGTSAYDLPVAYESIESRLYYAPDKSDFYPPVEERHDTYILKRQQDDDYTGRPLYFSVRTVAFDPTIGSRRQLILYPTPDDAYVLYAKMVFRSVSIDAVNQYPVGGEQLSQLILEACLAAAERNYNDAEGVHTKRFQELLPFAIRADQEASTPRTLGPDAPRGEGVDVVSNSILIGDVTLDGVVM